jgi:hypothetical protein
MPVGLIIFIRLLGLAGLGDCGFPSVSLSINFSTKDPTPRLNAPILTHNEIHNSRTQQIPIKDAKVPALSCAEEIDIY